MIPQELLERPTKWSLEDFEFNCIIVSDEELLNRLKKLESKKHNKSVEYFVRPMINIIKNEFRYRGYIIN